MVSMGAIGLSQKLFFRTSIFDLWQFHSPLKMQGFIVHISLKNLDQGSFAAYLVEILAAILLYVMSAQNVPIYNVLI